ncbi:MAG TPA: hypothetical protein VHG69_12430 [Thermoleophilaceae bacterium]|nr:hypothetical protein [Thermoleophilaceae bacterium]
MEASRIRGHGGYLELSRLTIGEFLGMAGALLLLASLWMPWFSTDGANENSRIGSEEDPVAVSGDSANAWEVFGSLDWLLLAACTAPFILTWIVARGHELTWKPGEVTMLVGMTAFALILCNGIILGKPEPGTGVSLDTGWFVGLVASVGLMLAGFLRQALHGDVRKPPGVL